MTIAKRLLLLLAVPLVGLVALGVLTRMQLEDIEAHSRFVAENQVASLAALGNVSRSFAEMRVNFLGYLLSTNPVERAAAKSAFDEDKSELNRLLRQHADKMVADEKDRRLLNDYTELSREWTTEAEEAMALVEAGRRD